eukprot:990547-Amphidinium_carterae.1
MVFQRCFTCTRCQEVAVDMTQIAVVPAFSFWAYDAPHRGTVRIAVLEAPVGFARKLLAGAELLSPLCFVPWFAVVTYT